MSMNLNYQSLKIQSTGKKATVPSSDLATLMYYLESVFTVIPFDINPRLKNYSMYYSLSAEEKEQVLLLCALFSPDVMLKLHLFIIAPDLVYPYTN